MSLLSETAYWGTLALLCTATIALYKHYLQKINMILYFERLLRINGLHSPELILNGSVSAKSSVGPLLSKSTLQQLFRLLMQLLGGGALSARTANGANRSKRDFCERRKSMDEGAAVGGALDSEG